MKERKIGPSIKTCQTVRITRDREKILDPTLSAIRLLAINTFFFFCVFEQFSGEECLTFRLLGYSSSVLSSYKGTVLEKSLARVAYRCIYTKSCDRLKNACV